MEQIEFPSFVDLNKAVATSSLESPWDAHTLRSRIDSADSRTRFEAGSPDKCEVALYRKALRRLRSEPFEDNVLVLGMTPELRQMALELGCQVASVDRSAESIALYTDWIDADLSVRETIVQANWFAIDQILPHKFDAILGDGVFGNILSLDGHREFLAKLKAMLSPGGALILRQALVPHGFEAEQYEALTLLNQFRAGALSQSEFGFGMRLWGSFATAYDKDKFLLDNAVAFERYQEWAAESVLKPKELEIIHRYYFGGLNMILPQEVWETMLSEAGFQFRIETLAGKAWYAYYPLYVCHAPHA